MPLLTKRAGTVVTPSQRARLGSRIVAIGVALIIAFVASSAFDAWRRYRQSLAAVDRDLASLARAIAEQTAHSFQTVDVLLRGRFRTASSRRDRTCGLVCATPGRV